QTQRLNPTVLTDDLRQALAQHAQITSANTIAHRALSGRAHDTTDKGRQRERDTDRTNNIGSDLSR
uniref:hypothetical protein n=1 Tax=Mycolicibacterium sp. TaxID=2320850 RepID=UPI0037C70872